MSAIATGLNDSFRIAHKVFRGDAEEKRKKANARTLESGLESGLFSKPLALRLEQDPSQLHS